MFYNFKCTTCDETELHQFHHDDYDKRVMEDGRLKRKKCKRCKTITLYRYVDANSMPAILGGTKNYMSMERYWEKNPGEARRKEDELASKLDKRHQDRVTSRIDKQQERKGSDKRHEGYGKGSGEQKLDSGS